MYPSCVGNIGRREKAWGILDNCKYLCKERQKKAGQEYIFMDLKVSASEMISDVSARKIGVGVGRIIPTPVCKELSEHEIEDTIFRSSWKVGRKKNILMHQFEISLQHLSWIFSSPCQSYSIGVYTSSSTFCYFYLHATAIRRYHSPD